MANYKVSDVREAIEGLDDDQAVFGFIITIRDGIAVPEGFDSDREPTTEEWEAIVDKADEMALDGTRSIWSTLWETVNDAVSEVCPYPEFGWCEGCKAQREGIVADHVDTEPNGMEHLHCPDCGMDLE